MGCEIYGAGEHAGHLRELVLGLKYGGDTGLAQELGFLVAEAIRIAEGVPDRITWAPTTRTRALARGFDQAELIARHAAAYTGLPFRRLLRRTNEGSQTSSSRTERLQRPCFVARPGLRGHVLVVDDVVTTGATFVAATRALLASGARRVTCVAASWAPDPRESISARRDP